MNIFTQNTGENRCTGCVFEKMEPCPAEDKKCSVDCGMYHIFVVDEDLEPENDR